MLESRAGAPCREQDPQVGDRDRLTPAPWLSARVQPVSARSPTLRMVPASNVWFPANRLSRMATCAMLPTWIAPPGPSTAAFSMNAQRTMVGAGAGSAEAPMVIAAPLLRFPSATLPRNTHPSTSTGLRWPSQASPVGVTTRDAN